MRLHPIADDGVVHWRTGAVAEFGYHLTEFGIGKPNSVLVIGLTKLAIFFVARPG